MFAQQMGQPWSAAARWDITKATMESQSKGFSSLPPDLQLQDVQGNVLQLSCCWVVFQRCVWYFSCHMHCHSIDCDSTALSGNLHNLIQNEFSFWFWKRLKWLFYAIPLPKVKEWIVRSNMYLSQQVECILGFCAIFCQHVNIIFGYNRFFQLFYPRPHQAAEDKRISLGADFIPSSISRIQFFLKTKKNQNKTENASSIYLCQHSLWL